MTQSFPTRRSSDLSWDKSKVVLVMDHYVPEEDDDSRAILALTRDWARSQQLPHVYDSIGICHVVLPQQGHIRPGMFCVGGDSHSPTGGAFGAYMFGIGSTRSEEHTSELQSLMRISYAVFCLKKKNKNNSKSK